MDDELVKSSSSEDGSVLDKTTYTEQFNKLFPYYLSIGMTEEQYWDRDCLLVKFYREAEELRKERMNQQAWLQGMYFYDALSRISPVLHAFAKRGTKAKPYVEEAYPITKKSSEQSQSKKEKSVEQKGLAFMQAFMVQNNKRYAERK